jgi:hypothetical protein
VARRAHHRPVPGRRVRIVAGAIALALAGGAVAAPGQDAAAGEASATREFEHRRHEALSCRACHGAGERHRSPLVRTALDCAACHHEAAATRSCGTCHRPRQLAAVETVTTPLALGVWSEPRLRVLPFAHAGHDALGCLECHGTPVTLSLNVGCAGCHAAHHRPEADCSACHPPARAAAHGPAAHLSCSGSGCHAPRRAPSPTVSRTLCLVCHDAQRDHEPAGACAACHLIPELPAREVTARGEPGDRPEANR